MRGGEIDWDNHRLMQCYTDLLVIPLRRLVKGFVLDFEQGNTTCQLYWGGGGGGGDTQEHNLANSNKDSSIFRN
jgi:hypothetical protein